ncbi:MAG TPA: EAL domain-containing protein [Steroidobacteraceae bacterium]|nr:EAL domain-containing protein [Steroidobacteraceae bacterium]
MALHILLIQDDAAGAKIVRDALANSRDQEFSVEWVRTCAQALARLAGVEDLPPTKAGAIAAVLVDLRLPDIWGIDCFNLLFDAAPQVPILILSTLEDEAVAKLAVHRGAHDYLLQDLMDGYLLPKTLAGMIDGASNTEALFDEKERAQVTLNSIGDAVISTDISDRVTFLNIVAEQLTGWPRAEAIGRKLEEIFRVVDADTRMTPPDPMVLATRENKTVALMPNCLLIRRDGVETAIEDSAAPIHNRRGQVTGAVMVFHDVSRARAQSAKMAHLAQHDSLTDLPNRSLLNDRLDRAIALAHRHNKILALLYLDLDRFKHINDSLGHAVGDRLLQSVANRLRDCIRASDTVSRQGGDEFIILLSELVHVQDAAVCAEKILQSVRAPYFVDVHELNVTASIGIVVYPTDGIESEALLQNADFAMYEAKNRGRNNFQFYRLDLNSSASERQSLESSLRHALQRDEFTLYYQPSVNLATRTIAGVEALVRWRHPTRGIILPTQFIPIAEESGMIVPIGRWVLREACRQTKAWLDAGLSPIRLAVNISAVELRSKEFLESVKASLSETGFDPHYLELELTETFLMQDSRSAALVLRALKDLGVKLALDDFGTGYSSLSYMKRFPIDTLKVDRSFVRDLTTDADDARIVNAVINMGKSLHMGVVAEGVETRDQFEFLQEHRCPEAQGYFFSHPLIGAGFRDLLRQGVGIEGIV